jgi:hypothetical protein
MRQIMARRIAGSEEALALVGLAFGSLTAEQVANPFFAMCREITDLDGIEREIEKRLREKVIEEIKERNKIAHGDWLIAQWRRPGDEPLPPTLIRVQAASPKNPVAVRELTVGQLDQICERVEALTHLVWEYGTICTSQGAHDPRLGHLKQRVRDALQIVAGQVVFGPGLHMGAFYEPD